jgi:hypothetical protein
VTNFRRSTLLVGGELGFFGNDSNIQSRSSEVSSRGSYLMPSLKLAFGRRRNFYLDTGAGLYLIDFAEFLCDGSGCGESDEIWGETQFGGYVGVSADLRIGQRWVGALAAKVHFVNFGSASGIAPESQNLNGPIYMLQVGVAFRSTRAAGAADNHVFEQDAVKDVRRPSLAPDRISSTHAGLRPAETVPVVVHMELHDQSAEVGMASGRRGLTDKQELEIARTHLGAREKRLQRTLVVPGQYERAHVSHPSHLARGKGALDHRCHMWIRPLVPDRHDDCTDPFIRLPAAPLRVDECAHDVVEPALPDEQHRERFRRH